MNLNYKQVRVLRDLTYVLVLSNSIPEAEWNTLKFHRWVASIDFPDEPRSPQVARKRRLARREARRYAEHYLGDSHPYAQYLFKEYDISNPPQRPAISKFASVYQEVWQTVKDYERLHTHGEWEREASELWWLTVRLGYQEYLQYDIARWPRGSIRGGFLRRLAGTLPDPEPTWQQRSAEAIYARLNRNGVYPSDFSFSRMVFPLIRRTFANTLANQIINVQPMPQSAGLVFMEPSRVFAPYIPKGVVANRDDDVEAMAVTYMPGIEARAVPIEAEITSRSDLSQEIARDMSEAIDRGVVRSLGINQNHASTFAPGPPMSETERASSETGLIRRILDAVRAPVEFLGFNQQEKEDGGRDENGEQDEDEDV